MQQQTGELKEMKKGCIVYGDEWKIDAIVKRDDAMKNIDEFEFELTGRRLMILKKICLIVIKST